jgi:hypothetical protein
MEVVVAFAVATFLGLVVLWFAARGAITVCVLEISKGKVEVVQGGLSPRVLSDVRDIVARPKVRAATLRIVRSKDRATLHAKGDVSDEQLQQLRNVIGNVPLTKLVNARRA